MNEAGAAVRDDVAEGIRGRLMFEMTMYPSTPDGRYFVVRGRLWRMSNPALDADRRAALVAQLMYARRALRVNRSADERALARRRVDDAKQSLGERGPVWWTDGTPDFNRKMVRNTQYAQWFDSLVTAEWG